VTGPPRSFVTGPDGKLLAVDVPDQNLRAAVAAALQAK
jgi:hypothetical protein